MSRPQEKAVRKETAAQRLGREALGKRQQVTGAKESWQGRSAIRAIRRCKHSILWGKQNGGATSPADSSPFQPISISRNRSGTRFAVPAGWADRAHTEGCALSPGP